ncbi:uncharacterized protein LOC112184875 [Rosa chinensis]|uniref:uncharacterized protein LOC112184875 n=1 Tax=Rosa chinensis TaxID=74649 RepID=UPI000D09676F|nr:uncharacterized protein LOC112184875 [Rosa chinensis]
MSELSRPSITNNNRRGRRSEEYEPRFSNLPPLPLPRVNYRRGHRSEESPRISELPQLTQTNNNRGRRHWQQQPAWISDLPGCDRCVTMNLSCSECWERDHLRTLLEDEELFDREMQEMRDSYCREQEDAIRRTRSASTETREQEEATQRTRSASTATRHSMFDRLVQLEFQMFRSKTTRIDDVKAKVRGMPTIMAIDDEACAVCLEGFHCVLKDDEGSTGKQTPCGHFFHQTCIAKWLSNPKYNSTCPLCRYSL